MAGWIGYFIMVPMVYVAAAVFVLGILARGMRLLASPRHPFPLRLYPASRSAPLRALQDTFLMPQVRAHAPLFWVFLILFHVAFLFLILGHLDLIPGIHLMPPDSVHMLGYGFIGLTVTLATFYFLLRRMRGTLREISVLGDYLLLLLLILLFLTGDTISWANSWNPDGFVIGKVEFGDYLQSLLSFSFANPRDLLPGSHYIVVVLHVLLANLFLILFPFTKIMHTFFALPMNRLRRL